MQNIKSVLYFLTKKVFTPVFKILYKIDIKGAKNIPVKGPYIIASKHSSYFDPLFITMPVKPIIHWIVAKYIYKHWAINPWCNIASCVPLNGSVKGAMALLEKSKVIGIFPEGGIKLTNDVRELKSGLVVLASKSRCPILPCFIQQETITFKAFGITLPRLFSDVKIIFGKTFTVPYVKEDIISQDKLKEYKQQTISNINLLCRRRSDEKKT
jgi:1-acyl-sn-glycerol-3-phosphate acyltransferase